MHSAFSVCVCDVDGPEEVAAPPSRRERGNPDSSPHALPSRHTAHPPYLSELFTHYLPSRALCSSNAYLLARPSGITSNFASGAFSVSAPSMWNSVPTHIRSLDKLSTFKRQLKSHLFQSAFAALVTLCQRVRFVSRFWCYINFYVCMYVCMRLQHLPYHLYLHGTACVNRYCKKALLLLFIVSSGT